MPGCRFSLSKKRNKMGRLYSHHLSVEIMFFADWLYMSLKKFFSIQTVNFWKSLNLCVILFLSELHFSSFVGPHIHIGGYMQLPFLKLIIIIFSVQIRPWNILFCCLTYLPSPLGVWGFYHPKSELLLLNTLHKLNTGTYWNIKAGETKLLMEKCCHTKTLTNIN